jgi:NTP pyrophosphatase (non-canonical NTP hydrolase)
MTPSDRLGELAARLRSFNAERQWEQFHSPKNLAMALVSEVGELAALFRWLTPEQCERGALDEASFASVKEEIGDTLLLLLSLSERLGVDPVALGLAKLQLNALKYPVETSRGRAEKPRDSK